MVHCAAAIIAGGVVVRLQYLDMLLEAFPIMRKLALDKDLLLLDLQRRMIELSIKVAASKIARDGEKAPREFLQQWTANLLINTSACRVYLRLPLICYFSCAGRRTSSIATILFLCMTMHRL